MFVYLHYPVTRLILKGLFDHYEFWELLENAGIGCYQLPSINLDNTTEEYQMQQ